MYSWCIKTALITSLFLSALVFSQNSTEIRWRTIYIIPEDISSLFSCPMDYCYSLQDVLSNSSYFFDSYTALELLPGVHNIIEKVGQLVLINVENFTLRSSSPNVTITCQSRSSFGLTVIQSHNIELSNIQISHCSAKMLLEESNNPFLTNYYNKKLGKVLEYNLSNCDAITNSFPACYTFFASFESKNSHYNYMKLLSLIQKELAF